MRQFRLKTETQRMPSVADLRARGDEITTDVVPAIDPRTDMGGPSGDDECEAFDAAAGDA